MSELDAAFIASSGEPPGTPQLPGTLTPFEASFTDRLLNRLNEDPDLKPIANYMQTKSSVKHGYLSMRASLHSLESDHIFNSDEITLNPDFKITRQTNEVTFVKGSDYAAGRNSSGTELYEYYLIHDKDGKIVDSVWATPSKKRPDFLWIPAYERSEREQELIDLIGHCLVISNDMSPLIDLYNQVTSDNVIDDQEQALIRNTEKQIQSQNPKVDAKTFEWLKSVYSIGGKKSRL